MLILQQLEEGKMDSELLFNISEVLLIDTTTGETLLTSKVSIPNDSNSDREIQWIE